MADPRPVTVLAKDCRVDVCRALTVLVKDRVDTYHVPKPVTVLAKDCRVDVCNALKVLVRDRVET